MSDQLPVLYSFRRCPYAMRARMAIRYAGIEVELREVLLKDKPAEMLNASSKGTVPVLEVEGQVIDESLDVMLWALDQSDPDNWLRCEDTSFSLVALNDTVFKADLDGYKYAGRDKEKELHHRQRGENFLAMLEENLSGHRYLSSDVMTLSDVAVMPFVRQFANVDITWFDSTPYEKLRVWLGELLASPLFTCVMKKYPVWKQGDDVTVF